MSAITLKSDEARQQWRNLLDKAMMGDHVIVERYARPEAVIVGYAKFYSMVERLQELEAWQEALRIKQAIDSGAAPVVTFEQHKARMGSTYDSVESGVQQGS